MQWVTVNIVPNLKPRTVLVIENASYHNTKCDKGLTSNSRKEEMIMWLSRKNIPFEQSMLKPQLHKIIEMNKPTFKCYVLNEVLEKEGHDDLHLPLYYPVLNPVELIWAEVKKLCCDFYSASFSIVEVKKLCKEKFSKMGPKAGMDSKVQACKENRR